MSKHLKVDDVNRIIEILDGWSGKLTWDALRKKCLQKLGNAPTRQTLYNNKKIYSAFQATKERIKSQPPEVRAPNISAKAAAQRIERLKAENTRLQNENDRLLEQFVRWQYNAYCRGLTESDLDHPLPETDRSRTD